jgi:hypothetical protein
MDRVKGLGSFVLIAAAVFGALRLVHVSLPLAFPETRQRPIAIARLDDVRQQAGFAAIVPAYRPATLGERPSGITLTYRPRATLTVEWQQSGEYLSVTQQRGGPRPDAPPLARPFEGVQDSLWWMDAGRATLQMPRGEFWITLTTSLPVGELRRFADTLTDLGPPTRRPE